MNKYYTPVSIVTFVFLLSSICFPKQAFSQYESVFGNSQTSWRLNSWGVTPEFIVCLPESLWLGYNQDTVFQGRFFKPLYTTFSNSNPYITGYVSEDSTSGEVWYRDTGVDTAIYKILNMSLTLNDSFYIRYSTLGGFNVAVDSIYYLNSRKHIRLDYQVEIISGSPSPSTFVYYTMIEGVGTNIGGVGAPGTGILVNQWKDNTLDYSANLDSNFICQTISGISEENPNVYIKIYPNPIHQNASIEMKGIRTGKIELFDVQGQLVRNFPINRGVLDFKEIKNGLYFLKVTTLGKKEISKKVIVQH